MKVLTYFYSTFKASFFHSEFVFGKKKLAKLQVLLQCTKVCYVTLNNTPEVLLNTTDVLKCYIPHFRTL